jgi:hypothetical protein
MLQAKKPMSEADASTSVEELKSEERKAMTGAAPSKAPRSLFDIVYSDEQLFREVKDWAFLLATRLWENDPIEGQEQEALGRVAGELLSVGNKLDALFEELFKLGAESLDAPTSSLALGREMHLAPASAGASTSDKRVSRNS